jgi:hypothetical protein
MEADEADGDYPFITAKKSDNGVGTYTSLNPTHEGNVISIVKDGDGGVCYAFYQEEEFSTNGHVCVAIPKFPLNKYIASFISTIILQERFKYSRGRAFGKKKIEETYISLPSKIDSEGIYNPDWEYIENYIKSLEYSSSLN